jgi:hypothetical protein
METAGRHLLFAGVSADPFDVVVVCRLAGGHTLDQPGV